MANRNVLAFYSTTFFRDISGRSTTSISTNALWLSWGVGLANFVFALPAYLWIDTRGRRFLLLATYPGMIFSMFGACMSFLANDSVKKPLICTFMFLFVVFYSCGQGPGKPVDAFTASSSLKETPANVNSGFRVLCRSVSLAQPRGGYELLCVHQSDRRR